MTTEVKPRQQLKHSRMTAARLNSHYSVIPAMLLSRNPGVDFCFLHKVNRNTWIPITDLGDDDWSKAKTTAGSPIKAFEDDGGEAKSPLFCHSGNAFEPESRCSLFAFTQGQQKHLDPWYKHSGMTCGYYRQPSAYLGWLRECRRLDSRHRTSTAVIKLYKR